MNILYCNTINNIVACRESICLFMYAFALFYFVLCINFWSYSASPHASCYQFQFMYAIAPQFSQLACIMLPVPIHVRHCRTIQTARMHHVTSSNSCTPLPHNSKARNNIWNALSSAINIALPGLCVEWSLLLLLYFYISTMHYQPWLIA